MFGDGGGAGGSQAESAAPHLGFRKLGIKAPAPSPSLLAQAVFTVLLRGPGRGARGRPGAPLPVLLRPRWGEDGVSAGQRA